MLNTHHSKSGLYLIWFDIIECVSYQRSTKSCKLIRPIYWGKYTYIFYDYDNRFIVPYEIQFVIWLYTSTRQIQIQNIKTKYRIKSTKAKSENMHSMYNVFHCNHKSQEWKHAFYVQCISLQSQKPRVKTCILNVMYLIATTFRTTYWEIKIFFLVMFNL
jgi:hypothetical protein